MFDNIATKLKVCAVIFTILGVISSIIYGIILFAEDLIGAGVLVIVFGSLSSWVGSFMMYGLGEAIEGIESIQYNTTKTESKIFHKTQMSNYTVANSNYKPVTQLSRVKMRCPDCRQEVSIDEHKCPYCGCDVQKYK